MLLYSVYGAYPPPSGKMVNTSFRGCTVVMLYAVHCTGVKFSAVHYTGVKLYVVHCVDVK